MQEEKKRSHKEMVIRSIPCRLVEEETPKDFLVGSVTSEINSLISPSNNKKYSSEGFKCLLVILENSMK